jgi:hypothetical protein
MARPRQSRGYLFAAMGLGLVLAGSCALGGGLMLAWAILWPDVPQPQASPVPKVDPAAFRQALARVHAAVPEPTGIEPRGCPDAEILAGARGQAGTGLQGQAVLAIPQVSYESLGAYARQGPRPYQRSGGVWPTAREDFGFDPAPPQGPDDWLWLEDYGMRLLFHPNLREGGASDPWGDAAREQQRILRDVQARRYLAVLRARERAMPRTREKGEPVSALRMRRRVLVRGRSFDPGRFHGAIVIMDLERAAAVCQGPLDAESAERLEYSTRAPFKHRPSDVVRDDFQDRLRQAARAALAERSRLLELR